MIYTLLSNSTFGYHYPSLIVVSESANCMEGLFILNISLSNIFHEMVFTEAPRAIVRVAVGLNGYDMYTAVIQLRHSIIIITRPFLQW